MDDQCSHPIRQLSRLRIYQRRCRLCCQDFQTGVYIQEFNIVYLLLTNMYVYVCIYAQQKAAAENKMEKDAQRDEIVGKGGIKERLIDLWLTVVDFFNVYPMALVQRHLSTSS